MYVDGRALNRAERLQLVSYLEKNVQRPIYPFCIRKKRSYIFMMPTKRFFLSKNHLKFDLQGR